MSFSLFVSDHVFVLISFMHQKDEKRGQESTILLKDRFTDYFNPENTATTLSYAKTTEASSS